MSEQQRIFKMQGGGGNPFGLIIAIAVIFLVFYLIAKFVQFLWWIAAIAMPVLLLLTFIINRKIITNYIGGIRSLYKRNKNLGIGATVLSILGSPFVILFMFWQAMTFRKIEQIKKETDGEYAEFEEIEVLEEKPLNLDEFTKRASEKLKEQQRNDDYTDLFE